MTFLRMPPRRWFWTLMIAAMLWCIAGNRWYTDIKKANWMGRTQDVAGAPASVLLTPAFYVATLAQGAATSAITRVTVRAPDAQSADELRDRLRALEDENTQLKQMIIQARDLLAGFKHLEDAGIKPEDALSATVLGYESGQGSRILRLDKGESHGVKVDDAVLAPLEQVSVLGRVFAVHHMGCEVRLLTDPGMSVHARIVRPRPQTTPQAAPSADLEVSADCLVVGQGNRMDCTTVPVQQAVAPQKGDLVLLNPVEWPAKTQSMVIGQVEEVARRDDQALRYYIRIVPRVPIMTQRTVMILINDK